MASPVTAAPVAAPSQPRRHRWIVLPVILVVVVAAYLGLVWYPTSITLTEGCGDWNPTPDYEGNASGYLFVIQEPLAPSSHDNGTCLGASMSKIAPGAHLPTSTTLKNAQLHESREIVSMSVSAPFGLVSVSPTLPVTIPENGNVTFAVVVSAPTTPGSYDFPGGTVLTE